MTDGILCGWRVQSELRLPELSPWPGGDVPADIIVCFGAVPERLDDVMAETPFLQIGRDGTGLLSIDDVGRFLIEKDRVTIAPRDGVQEVELRLFLLGSVLGFLCHRRGLFPLHGSCVVVKDRALAFCGPSGAGKSTMAAALALRGHALLCDDVCVVDAHAAGGPRVLPAFGRLKLWRDTLEAVGLDSSGLERNRPFQEKYHYKVPAAFDGRAVPLSAIYILRAVGQGDASTITPLEGLMEKIQALHANVFRVEVAKALGQEKALFSAEGKIAAMVPIFRWQRTKDFARIERDLALLTG